MAVSGEVEEDQSLLPGLLRRLRLVEHCADRVSRLGTGDDPLAAGEADRGLERGRLLDRCGLDQALLDEGAEAGRVAVVAKAPGVDRGGTKSWPSVYIGISGVIDRVTEVVRVAAPGQRRARRRFGPDETNIGSVAEALGEGMDRRPPRSSSRRRRSR